MTTAMAPARHAVSPYARRLARERGIALEGLAGSGPGGRIVAADIAAFVPRAAAGAHVTAMATTVAALATTIDLSTIRLLLAGFSGDDAFTLEDVALRAAGCAVDDVAAATALEGAPVALEGKTGEGHRAQAVFADIRKDSLRPLRQRRLAAAADGRDDAALPAALSLRILLAADIRPLTMPLLPGRNMRLVVVAAEKSAECLLTFDTTAVDEDTATAVLARFKGYLEAPIRLLA